MKKVFLYAVAAVFCMCCPSLEQKCRAGDRPGIVSRSRRIVFPNFSELNQGVSPVNDHEGDMDRSRLAHEYRSYTEIPCGPGTEVPVVPEGRYPTYLRVSKASCGDWIVLFNTPAGNGTRYILPGNTSYIARSKDLKSIYSSEVLNDVVSYKSVNGGRNKRVFSGAFGLGLANGDYLIVSSYRPARNYKSLPEECGLWIRRSTDGGRTFPAGGSHSKPIFSGNITWEPMLLQLPDGTVQCYFTLDEYSCGGDAPAKVGSGFGLIESRDNGETWSDMKVVVRQWSGDNAGGGRFTEQMPAVVLLNTTDGTMTFGAAAEDHIEGYTPGDEHFEISFFRSGNDGTWESIPLDGSSTGPVDSWRHCWPGGSPSMIQFPSGELVVAYSGGYYRMSRAADVSAWEEEQHSAYRYVSGLTWGSVTRLSSHMMLSAGNYYFPQTDGTRTGGIVLVQSALNHSITATRRRVRADGVAREWANTDEALMIGGRSQAEAFIRASRDSKRAYFLIEVPDDDLVCGNDGADDRMSIYLAAPQDVLDGSAVRITVSPAGLLSVSRFDAPTGWKDVDDIDVRAAVSYDGTVNRKDDTDRGYVIEISIPLSSVPAEDGKILFDACLYDNAGGADAVCDFLSQGEEAVPGRTSTKSWLYIKGF